MDTKPTSNVAQYVLQSFNLLDATVAKDLSNIVNYLTDIRKDNSGVNPHLTQQNSQQRNSSHYYEETSERSSYERVAGSFGVSGSYGFYSGSLKVVASSEKYNHATSFSSSCIGTIQLGTVYFNGSDDEIVNYIEDALVKELKAISDLKSAEKFIDKYGTHIATGWNLGGAFSLEILATTDSYESQTQVSSKVNAVYKSVATVNASASAAFELLQTSISSDLSIFKEVSGGNAVDAGGINLKQPDTGIEKWVKSIDEDSTYGLYKKISFSELASKIGATNAEKYLSDYVDLFLLKYSLENPTVFANHKKCVPFESTSATVVAGSKFKIVTGGAHIEKHGTTWLTGSYPSLNDQNQINGWSSSSHDIGSPSSHENITSYAMAVYDPGDHLKVLVAKADGKNTGTGADQAEASIPSDLNLVGGGCKTTSTGGYMKFMMSSHPVEPDPVVPNDTFKWRTYISDYVNGASDVKLTAYAIGIKSDFLEITRKSVQKTTPSPVSHGNESASLGDGLKVIGGGVHTEENDSWGSLAKQTWPSAPNTWTEYNADLEGHVSRRNATAYAIGLKVNIKGLE